MCVIVLFLFIMTIFFIKLCDFNEKNLYIYKIEHKVQKKLIYNLSIVVVVVVVNCIYPTYYMNHDL
jgi:hypothetical protein